MSQTILYFTQGPKPTTAELAQITTLNSLAASPYVVKVLNGEPRASVTLTTVSAAVADNSYNDAGATITAATISAVATDNSFNDSGNGFVSAGFAVGDYVTVTGFTGSTANNVTNVKVTALTEGKMTVEGADGDVLVADDAGESVTITAAPRFTTAGFQVGDHVMVRGFTGNAANNITDATITALTGTKMTIGGADGDVIVNDDAGESVTICTRDESVRVGTGVLTADYVAGTVPEEYKTNGTAIYTVFDPANPPDVPALIDTQTVVSNAETLALDTAGTVTFAVAAGVMSGDVAATEAVVAHGDTVAVGSDDVTLSVVAHAVTGALPATKTIVASADTITVDGQSVALTVSGGVLQNPTMIATGSTHKVIATAQEIAFTGGAGTTKVKFTIVDGVITACERLD